SPNCDSSLDGVKNPAIGCRDLYSATIHGILRYVFFAEAKKTPLRMTLIFGLFLCGTFFLSSCSSNEVKPTTAPLTGSDDLPSQISAHTRMTLSSEGLVHTGLKHRGVRVF